MKKPKLYNNSGYPGGISRTQAIAMFVLHGLNELVDAGVMTEGKYQFTPAGEQAFVDLMATGFRPTDEEVQGFLSAMVAGGDIEIPADGKD